MSYDDGILGQLFQETPSLAGLYIYTQMTQTISDLVRSAVPVQACL